jgi:hypothetical protein
MDLEDGRALSMPATDKEMVPYLWENEKPIPISPTVLQPGHSMRFATSRDRMAHAVKNAGYSGPSIQEYRVAV